MKAALAILLLCAACASGGHAKRPVYPPGYVLSETVLRGDVWERWDWMQSTASQPAGTTVFEYRIADQ